MGICDSTTGQCELSQSASEQVTLQATPQAQVWFVTDPVCSHCWAMEPAWREFLFLYRDQLAVRYIYGGLLPSWEGFSRGGITSPADLIPHFAEVAEHYGQPIDSSLWLVDPPASSYPPSIATHIVRQIAPEREEAYLRRLRQAVFLERRNFARSEVLVACAGEIGLDEQQFAVLLNSGAGKSAFERDLQESRQLQVTGFPTLFLINQQQQALVLRGSQSFAELEGALLRVTGLTPKAHTATVPEVLRAYGSGTTREFAEVLGLPLAETAHQLTEAGAISKPVAGDALWFNPD